MKKIIPVLLLALLAACASKKQLDSKTDLQVQKIWDRAPHNAFTDLIRYKNKFYCTFREAPGHVSGPAGNIRVLMSADGTSWISVDSVKMEGLDLRDPKLSITPDNRLMVLMDVETYKDGKVDTRKPFVMFSADGKNFTNPQACVVDPGIAVRSDWVWRVTWYKGVGYAIDYQPDALYLLKTTDGKNFQNVYKLDVDGYPNESTVRFDKNGKIYVLIRREREDQRGILATSNYPYTQWEYNKLTERLGGPNFIFLDDHTLCIGTRKYYPANSTSRTAKASAKTAIYTTDLQGNIKKTLIVEKSGGDNSYPGMVLYQNYLWLSYYSSHEGKTSIYLAKVPQSNLYQ